MRYRSAILLALWLSLAMSSSVSKFQVNFVHQPSVIRYNVFYEKFELLLELNITEVGTDGVDADKLVVTGLKILPESAINSRDFGAKVLARLSSNGTSGQLVFMCKSLRRCWNIKSKIDADPEFIRQSVEFMPIGLQNDLPTTFATVRSTESPGSWPTVLTDGRIVFQQKLNNELSFARNWDSYVSGFGSPNSNYWMGLEQLSALTKDRQCVLTFELVSFSNITWSASFRDFQLRGADENYKLRVGTNISGNQFINNGLSLHADQEFSTYDRDNDKSHSKSCPQYVGENTGWWYNDCYNIQVNAKIIQESKLSRCSKDYGFADFKDINGKWQCLKTAQLSFKCTG